MKHAVSCGGIVIFRGKILLLYKNLMNKYEGWVLPKGTVDPGETYEETALREVKEESGVSAEIVEYLGNTNYVFTVRGEDISKEVHWYLMSAKSYYSKPQHEEYFFHSGYYRYIEAYHLLKFPNEKAMLQKAYKLYRKRNRKKK